MKLNKQKIKVACSKCMQPIQDTLNDIYYAEGLQSWVIPLSCNQCDEELEDDTNTRIDEAISGGYKNGYEECEDEYKIKLDKKTKELEGIKGQLEEIEKIVQAKDLRIEQLKNRLRKKSLKQS